MKKGIVLLAAMLCVSAVAGCGLLPFEEDIPVLSEKTADEDEASGRKEKVLAINATATPTPDPYTSGERKILTEAAGEPCSLIMKERRS